MFALRTWHHSWNSFLVNPSREFRFFWILIVCLTRIGMGWVPTCFGWAKWEFSFVWPFKVLWIPCGPHIIYHGVSMNKFSGLQNWIFLDWSLQSLFGRSIQRNCPAASSSSVQVNLPRSSSEQWKWDLSPQAPVGSDSDAIYDVLVGRWFQFHPRIPIEIASQPKNL